jgi:hypothetical protein
MNMFMKAINQLCWALALAIGLSMAVGILLCITVNRQLAFQTGLIVFVLSLPGALFTIEESQRRKL